MHILSIILVGIALSMDTFSLSLGIGAFNITNKKAIKLSLIVGSMHFLMPFIGMLIGDKLIEWFSLKCDILLGIILLIIAIEMIIDLIRHEEEKFNLSLIGMLFFALGVSLDSFSVGLGIKAITDNIYLAMIIFSICSATFTYIGLIVGKFANKLIGRYANILGIIILLILSIHHLF